MPNSYYNHSTYPAPNAPGSSAALRAELDLVTAGFNLLPTLAGNGYKVAMINAAGTALIASAALQALAITASTIDSTPIGATTRAAGNFTTLQANAAVNLGSSVTIAGGTINGTQIGNTTASSGAFTTLTASGGITGALTGNVTGNVTGNLSGNVTTGSGTSTFNDVTINGTLDMNSGSVGTITGLALPTNSSDAANKQYVDNVAQGLDVKASCRVATTANITLSGTQTIDGVAVIAGDRVLVKNQTNQGDNGVYVAAAGGWTRSTDMDAWSELPGAFLFIEEGTVNDNSGWVCTVSSVGTLGGTNVTFEQFSGAGQITAGAGMTKSGNTLNVGTANVGRIVVNADDIDLATTGVAASTYRSVTVDAYGRVTGGTNPTTVATYGLTDVYTKTEVDSILGSATAAAASASAAATSATNAANSATSASTSATNASTSASNALSYLNTFRGTYIGASATNPTVDGNGAALTAGDLYFNTAAGEMRVYNGSSWLAAYLPASGYLALSGGTMTGNIAFSGSGLRITGDLSNATIANRLMVQTSTTNTQTLFGVIPNGTAQNAQLQVYNSSDPNNSSIGTLTAGSTLIRLVSGVSGTGTQLPLAFIMNATEIARFDTAGNFGIGTSSPAAKLDVNGDALISGLAVGKGAGAVVGNTAVGASALNANTTGTTNTAVGYQAGYSNTTGGAITVMGYQAGYANTTGDYTTAFGYGALKANTTGYHNAAFGDLTLQANTTGLTNSAFGNLALYGNTTGSNNTAVGYQAGYGNTTANNSTAVGYQALYGSNTVGSNTAVGVSALLATTSGTQNVAVGGAAMQLNTTGSYNVAMGLFAGYSNTTGSLNVAIGQEALYSNTTASGNIAVGYTALYANTTGTENTAVGGLALKANTTGSYNTAFGGNSGSGIQWHAALRFNTTGSHNAAFGDGALAQNTTASYNTAMGTASLYSNTTASNNTAMGYQALYANTTGANNVAVGYGALDASNVSNSVAIGYNAASATAVAGYGGITAVGYNAAAAHTGYAITAIGSGALQSNTSGINNVAVGHGDNYYGGNPPLGSNTTGSENVAVGTRALGYNTTGQRNVAVGNQALQAQTTAFYNTGVGDRALTSTTTGGDNAAFGYISLLSNTTGGANTSLGSTTLFSNTTGNYNTAAGATALYANTTGGQNTAVGFQTLYSNTTASQNTAIGIQALYNNTTGPNLTALGYKALFNNTTADNNVAIGYLTLGSVTTGAGNTAIGTQAGYDTVAITTGLRNTLLGAFTRPSSATADSQIVIGYNLTGQADSNVTIGSASGKIYNAFTVNATWTQTSDGTMKNIVGPDTLGLSFINRLNPIKFTWKPENELPTDHPYYKEINGKDTTTVIHGFVAQEVKAALDAEGCTTFNGWDQGSDGIQAISREMFISPLVKAVQELSAQVQALQAEIATLKGA